jgi:tetratricopeptide (TPR) repeat protein
VRSLIKKGRVMRPFMVLFLLYGYKGSGQEPEKIISENSEEEQFYSRLNDSIKTNPTNPLWHYLRGTGYQEKGMYKNAVPDLSMVMSYLKKEGTFLIMHGMDNITICEILYQRAFCYEKIDSLDSAVNDYRALLSCNFEDIQYQISIPRLYIKHKKISQAQKEISQMLSQKPDNERALVYQGILDYEMGSYEKALFSVNNCLEKHPNSIEGLVTKAKILIKKNKLSDACNLLDEAKKKMNLDYFGGQRGYMRSFDEEIKSLQNQNCN